MGEALGEIWALKNLYDPCLNEVLQLLSDNIYSLYLKDVAKEKELAEARRRRWPKRPKRTQRQRRAAAALSCEISRVVLPVSVFSLHSSTCFETDIAQDCRVMYYTLRCFMHM